MKPTTHGKYTLYTKNVRLRGGRSQPLYFFSKKVPRGSRPTTMPKGYKIGVSKRTGLPYRVRK